ncbi:MAG: DUF6290 family protein [Halanaerobiales bacterium]
MEEQMKIINIRLTEAEHKALRQYSLDTGKTVSTLFRQNILIPAQTNMEARKY